MGHGGRNVSNFDQGRTETVANLRQNTTRQASDTAPLSSPSTDLIKELPRQSVLVVDDSPTDLRYIGRLLEAPDRHILMAAGGEEALNILKGVELALVILDVHMDGMDGFETAERMRDDERTQDIPIIFVTATGLEEETVFQGYDAGAVDYLFKPVEPNLLRSKVNVFCQLSSQRLLIQEQLRKYGPRTKSSAASSKKSKPCADSCPSAPNAKASATTPASGNASRTISANIPRRSSAIPSAQTAATSSIPA